MASLDLLVNIALDVSGPSVQVPSFGIPLVAGSFTSPAWTERVRSYSSLADAVADGLPTKITRAVGAVFAQSPAPESCMVGRRALPSTNSVVITPTVANSRLYSFDVIGADGVSYVASYTSDADATAAEIATGITAAINALAAGAAITATGATTTVTVLADVPGAYFAIAPTVETAALVALDQPHADPGIGTDLDAILAEGADWYGFTIADDQGGATLTAAAVWAGANKKVFFAGSQDFDILGAGSSDVVSVVKATANDYASIGYHLRAGHESLGGAAFGVLFSHDPGAISLHGKRLSGITADALSGTALANITAKYGLSYTTYGSLPMLREGRATSGQWIDVVRDLDWVKAEMQADLVNAIASNAKLPYTDAGVAVLVGAVRAMLGRAEAAGVFASGWSVSGPKVATIGSVDKGNRTYGPITWTATLAGAIHSVTVRGTVTY